MSEQETLSAPLNILLYAQRFPGAYAELLRLMPMSDGALKKLWDAYDGTNSPLGFDGTSIHIELNRRGLGLYCAV
jgi:hypothetical protein